ncbi:MAG: hypothetical protein ABIT38_15265 [Gemmatimonadaceae bacterium]
MPRRALSPSALAAPKGLAGIEWGQVEAIPVDYQRQLAAVATPGRSLNADQQTWGVEDGNRIDVWSVEGRAMSVTARVDVRRLDSRFGALLLQFVRGANAVLVRRDGLVVEPIIGAFASALRSSAAWRFANDPAEFLAAHPNDEPNDV